jgi:hypothetical protein
VQNDTGWSPGGSARVALPGARPSGGLAAGRPNAWAPPRKMSPKPVNLCCALPTPSFPTPTAQRHPPMKSRGSAHGRLYLRSPQEPLLTRVIAGGSLVAGRRGGSHAQVPGMLVPRVGPPEWDPERAATVARVVFGCGTQPTPLPPAPQGTSASDQSCETPAIKVLGWAHAASDAHRQERDQARRAGGCHLRPGNHRKAAQPAYLARGGARSPQATRRRSSMPIL